MGINGDVTLFSSINGDVTLFFLIKEPLNKVPSPLFG